MKKTHFKLPLLIPLALILLGAYYLRSQEACQSDNAAIDLQALAPITRDNLTNLQALERFSEHFIYPHIDFSPTSESLAITGLGNRSNGTLFPHSTLIWEFNTGCRRMVGEWGVSQYGRWSNFIQFSSSGDYFLLRQSQVSLYPTRQNQRILRSDYTARLITFPQGDMIVYQNREGASYHVRRLNDMRRFNPNEDIPLETLYAFSPDFHFFITLAPMQLWDAATNTLLHDLREDISSSPIHEAHFSPTSRWLFARDFVWDTETGTLQLSMENESFTERGLMDNFAFLQDDTHLAHGRYIWSLESQRAVAKLGGSTFGAAAPDDSFIIGVVGNSVWFWDGMTFEKLFELNFDRPIVDVAVSPDQRLIAIVGLSEGGGEAVGFVQLWGVPQP